jgi:hypothetical protein
MLFTRLAPDYLNEEGNLAEATKWLEGIRNPNIAGHDTIEFVTLTGAEIAVEPSCLTSLVAALRVDPSQAVVRNDTIDFNIHHDEAAHNQHLPVYSIGDNEFGICWTFSQTSSSMRGLVWYFNEKGDDDSTYILTRLSHLKNDGLNALTPALLTLQVENNAMRTWIDNQAEAITALQIQTGHHLYVDAPYFAGALSQHAQIIDLETMTRKISGLAVNVTTSALCMQRLVQLAGFILDEAESQPSDSVTSALIQRTKSAKNQAHGLLLESQAWQHKSTIVMQTLLSLVTQRDQSVSIEIARDSRILAQKATRDSTSMKAIAAVTMCFLPGTFVASLFAMPMFDWDAGVARSVNKHFWIYWAVTLPLTAVVFGMWLGWTERRALRRWIRGRRKEAEEKVE